jgi:hypothetical protein
VAVAKTTPKQLWLWTCGFSDGMAFGGAKVVLQNIWQQYLYS